MIRIEFRLLCRFKNLKWTKKTAFSVTNEFFEESESPGLSILSSRALTSLFDVIQYFLSDVKYSIKNSKSYQIELYFEYYYDPIKTKNY